MGKILKFSTVTCQPCKAVAAMIEKIGATSSVVNVDVDKDTDTAIQYRIRSTPTLVMVDTKGIEIKRLTGVHSEAFLREWVAELT